MGPAMLELRKLFQEVWLVDFSREMLIFLFVLNYDLRKQTFVIAA